MRRMMFVGLASVAMMVAACGSGGIGEPEGSSNVPDVDTVTGLLLDENSESVTRGRFITTDGRISFFATSNEDARLLRVQINGKTFEVTVDGSVTVDGHDAVLTVAEKAFLMTFSEAVTSRFQMETTGATRFEGLATLGSYLSEAPDGYVHRRLVNGQALPEGVAAAGTTPAITCFQTHTGVKITGKTLPTTSNLNMVVSYDAPLTGKIPTSCAVAANAGANLCTRYGGVPIRVTLPDGGVGTPTECLITEPVVLGSSWGTSVCNGGNYACMGLCGGGCSGTKYTVQCLKHDACSHDDASTAGSGDVPCGDEFGDASDDMFGSCVAWITLPAK